MDDRSSCLAAGHNHMFNDTGEFVAAFYTDFDGASIQKKRAAQFEAPLQVDRMSLKPVYCITLVQTLSIRDCALGEQVGAKNTFKSAGGLISGADFSSSE